MAMKPRGDGIFGAIIPAQPNESFVRYYFTATDNLSQSAAGDYGYYYVNDSPLFISDVVADNDDGAPGYTETGSWTLSSGVGYDGGTYHYTLDTSEPSTATWTPDLPRDGVYKVYAAFYRGTNRTTSAPITINHAFGQENVYLDQTGSSLIVEVLLGEFPFNSGTGSSIVMDNSGAPGAYIADAMIFQLPSDPLPVISMMSRSPIIPDDSEPVLVTAKITDNVSVSSASLSYTVDGGASISVPAYDDGAHSDGAAGDSVYGATIPAQTNNAVVSLYFSATDNLGQSATSSVQRFVVGKEVGNVYIVYSSDTSVWGVSGYGGEASWDVFESREGVLNTLYKENFRHSITDSVGNPFKVTWFMHGGAWFNAAPNSTAISATYHIRKNWNDDIELWGDALEYHFHHYVWDEDSWEMAPTFAETIWEYEQIMSQMMLDEYLFITSFRSGWNYMDDVYQQYLERWVPFRMEGTQSDWIPYHPSFSDYKVPGTMKGWEVRHIYTKSVSESIANSILGAADSGGDRVVCIWSHQNEQDFPEQLATVDQNLHSAQSNYPAVQFYYLSAKEGYAPISKQHRYNTSAA